MEEWVRVGMDVLSMIFGGDDNFEVSNQNVRVRILDVNSDE